MNDYSERKKKLKTKLKPYKNELTNRFQSFPNLQLESSGRSEFLHLHRCT